MQKLFIDTDIILDLLARRKPYFADAAKMFVLVENKLVLGFTSPLVFANLYYILRKQGSKELALTSLRKLRTILSLLPLDEATIDRALNSPFTDFEDAIQHEVACNHAVDFIITRNMSDYKISKIKTLTAKNFLLIRKARGVAGKSF